MLGRCGLAASVLTAVLLSAGCASSLAGSAQPGAAPSSPGVGASPAPSTSSGTSSPSSGPSSPPKPKSDPHCGGLRVAAVAYQVGRAVEARRTANGCAFTTRRAPQLVVQIGRRPIGEVTDGLAGAVQGVREAMPGAAFATLQLARGGFVGVGDLPSSTPVGGLGLAQVRGTLVTVSVKQQAVAKRALDDAQVSRLLVGVLAMMSGLG